MSYLESLLRQDDPLGAYDREDLREWLRTLEEDCKLFGQTPEDMRRMAAIRAKLDADTANKGNSNAGR